MIYVIQILLVGALVALVFLRFDISLLRKIERRRARNLSSFVSDVDTYLVNHNNPELSGLAYRSRLLHTHAREPSETIASIRLILGSVFVVAEEHGEIKHIRSHAELAIASIKLEQKLRTQCNKRWRFLCMKGSPTDETAIQQARTDLLMKFSNTYK